MGQRPDGKSGQLSCCRKAAQNCSEKQLYNAQRNSIAFRSVLATISGYLEAMESSYTAVI